MIRSARTSPGLPNARQLLISAVLVLLVLFICVPDSYAGTINFNGHNPNLSIGYTDGTHKTTYSAAPNMRQGNSSTGLAKSTIAACDATDLYVNFIEDTTNKYVFLVYTTNGTAPTRTNGTPVAAEFSRYNEPDRTWVAQIPATANSAGAEVRYVFYRSNSNNLSAANVRVAADGYQTNWTEGDSYFSYTVASGTTGSGGNWSSGSSWAGGSVPNASNAAVEICSGATVTLDANVDAAALKVNQGGSFSGGSGSHTLTIADNGTLTNHGTYTANTETIAFAGTGTVAGTVTLHNVNLLATTSAKGVDFGSSATLNGTLTINTYRYVATNAPTYATGSTLKYNTGGSFNRADEWKYSGAGVPHNVQIANNTALNVLAGRTANGAITIDSGSTLVAPTGELAVGGDWTNNGTFTHNNGIVRFNGGHLQEVNSSTTFYDLIISGSGTDVDFNSTTTTIAHNFSKTGGSMTPGTGTFIFTGSGAIDGSGAKAFYDLQINAGANIANSSGGNISIGRHFSNNGIFAQGAGQTTTFNAASATHSLSGSGTTTLGGVTINGSTTVNSGSHNLTVVGSSFSVTGVFAGGTATTTFAGSSAQTIDGSGTVTFGGLTLNNASGLDLGKAVAVDGLLTLTNGQLRLGTNTLTLGSSATVSGGSTSALVVADGSGSLCKSYSASGSFTFPIGDATGTTDYSPATVNFTSGTFGPGLVCARVTNAKHPENGSADHLARYWTVTQSGISSFSADVSFSYSDGDVVGLEANLYGAQYNGSSWSILNAANTGANTLGGTVSSFSDFTGGNSTLPVTLAYFQASAGKEGVQFAWQTTTETGNVGFNLYVATKDGLQLVNDQLIPSAVVDSIEPQIYGFDMAGPAGDLFYLEDVDIVGRRLRHGPFKLGEAYGAWVEVDPINWPAIRAEHEQQAGRREAAALPALQASFTPELGPGSGLGSLNLLVDQSGLYRLTYEEILAFGIDPAGIPLNRLELSYQDRPVPLYVQASGRLFGPGDYLEFHGSALDSPYSHTNIYQLSLGRRLAMPVDRSPIPNQTPPASYLATVTVDNNRAYSPLSPTGNPWYQETILAYTTPVARHYPITIDQYVAGGGPASLSVHMWGYTDWLESAPDHHVIVEFNGVPVAEELFDGIVDRSLTLTLPDGLLQEGSNTLTLRLPGDTGVAWDMLALDSYSVTYPRAFVANGGQLTFTAAGEVFAVYGLPGRDTVVYRLDDSGLTKLGRVRQFTANDGSTIAAFRGSAQPATYLVSSASALTAPGLAAGRAPINLLDQPADYLVIAHADFLAGIQPLVDYHAAEGLSTRVVDVADIYATYSGGAVDPHAIRAYIADAAAGMGTKYVLLVGGDTYDYFDYLGQGSISFLPTLYAATGNLVQFAPVDPLYTDLNGDNVPDLAIGRFPVRTAAELDNLVAKTLAYANKDYSQTALFAADAASGVMSYAAESDNLINQLPAGWMVDRAYIDDIGLAAARAALLDGLNSGVALTSFFGHSGTTRWTFQGLFNAADAAALTNAGRPTVVSQWGCWNTYHVSPAYNTVAHQFLLAGDRGAAAVLGASTLTLSSSDKALGGLLTPYMVQSGLRLGQAIQLAKADLAQTQPELIDVLLGWTLLGDPALVVVAP